MRDWAQVEQYLRRMSETDGITEDHLCSMRQRRGTEGPDPGKLTNESVDSWSRFRKGETLTLDDKSRLEAIVIPNGLRPSFDIQNGGFPDLPIPWESRNAHRPFLNSCIRGIGRLNVPGHATLQYAGTAFVVGERLLLTNRHVAEAFCQTGGSNLVFTPGIAPSVDMKQEVGSPSTEITQVTKPVLILPDWDAALFQIDAMPNGAAPLKLASVPPTNASGRLATIIGYPALDTRGSTEEILQQIQIFRAIFDKKRLQPGRLLGYRQAVSFGASVNALAHDCSTLGGNSGSTVIDVEGETIVGLHFGGDYLVANYAVPSWELAGHQRLRDEGVLFT